MLESWLRRLARTIDANPRRIAIACLIAAVLAAAVVMRIPVTTDLLDVMPDQAPAIVAFTDFLRDFGILGGLVIVVETEATSPDSLLAVVQNIGEQLSVSPLVESVDYNLLRSGFRLVAEHFPVYLDTGGIARLAARLTPEGIRDQIRKNREVLLSPLASPFEAEGVRRDPLNIRGLVRDALMSRLPAQGLDLSTGYYLDRSHRLALLMVRPRGSTRDMSFVRALHREVSRIATQAVALEGNPGDMRIGLAGGYARGAEAVSVIWHDMVFSFATSLLLIVLLLYYAFRPSIVVLCVFVVTLFAALAWTLLLAYVLYGTLNIVTSIVAAMLIGLFVDYMIQVYRRFEECYRLDASPLRALERTLAGTGKAICSSALTTAVSFFSVVITSFRGMHQLGVVAGFGILFCLLATLVLMAALLSWLAKRRPTLLPAGRPVDLGAGWAARLVERNRRALITSFAVLLALATRGRCTGSVRCNAGFPRAPGKRRSGGGREDPAGARKARGAPLSWSRGLQERSNLPCTSMPWRDKVNDGEPVAAWAASPLRGCSFPRRIGSGKPWRAFLSKASPERSPVQISPSLVRNETSRQGLVADASLDAYAAGIARALAVPRGRRPAGALPRAGRARVLLLQSRPEGYRGAPDVAGTGWDRATLSTLEADVRRLGAGFPPGRTGHLSGRDPGDDPVGGGDCRVALLRCEPRHRLVPFPELAAGSGWSCFPSPSEPSSPWGPWG